jgi:RimJ/RimL family protein N-acetyltransferase
MITAPKWHHSAYDRGVRANGERQPVRVELVRAGDSTTLDGVSSLLVDAVHRGEALGLNPAITREQYDDYLERLMQEAERGDAALVAARSADGTVIGAAQWTRNAYPTRKVLGELDRVVVTPESRGAGVGRALIDAIAADARAAGIEVLMLEVRGNNHGALALYERNGFRYCGTLPNVVAVDSVRHDVVLMSRDLSRPPNTDLLGHFPAGQGASLPHGTSQGPDWQRTERLLLCLPTPDVADAYFAIHGDPATNVHNPAGAMLDPRGAAPILESWQNHWREHGYGYWVLRAPETGEVLGFGGVRPPLPDEDFLNLYYRLRTAAWGKGYATELGRAALTLAAKASPGAPVVALIRPRNEPSIRVAQRLGLRFDGEVQRQLGIYLKFSIIPELPS